MWVDDNRQLRIEGTEAIATVRLAVLGWVDPRGRDA